MQGETITIVHKPMTRSELEDLSRETFRDMIKGVADLSRGIIALGGSLHSDIRTELVKTGSQSGDLWGFTLTFAEKELERAIRYGSMINVRPEQGNNAMEIKLPEVRARVLALVEKNIVWK